VTKSAVLMWSLSARDKKEVKMWQNIDQGIGVIDWDHSEEIHSEQEIKLSVFNRANKSMYTTGHLHRRSTVR
jgi:hypothetical protein